MIKKSIILSFLMIVGYSSMAQTYKYDAANRLVQVSSNCSGTKYEYDQNGNRLSITEISITTTSLVSDEKCGNDGKISITPKNASANYRYQWSNGQTTATINDLPGGPYSVVITEPLTGFTCNQSFTINKAFKDSLTVSSTIPTCFNGSDGKARVNIVTSNPNGIYQYHWNTKTDTTFYSIDSITNLKAGNYSVAIRNTFTGCVKTILFTINQPLQFLTGISTTPLSCNLSNDGTATVVTDPTDYTYSWTGTTFNGIQTTQQITGLAAGTYVLSCIQKSTNCTITDTVTIAGVPTFLSTTKTNSKCYKASNGTATAIVPNDPNMYSYIWSGPFSGTLTTQQISNLSPGKYKIRVMENFGNHCTELDSLTITEPTKDILQDIVIVPINCKGQDDGIAEVKVTGSTSDYKYQWYYKTESRYLNQNTYRVTDLKPGIYIVTVTGLNSNACTSSKQFTINESTINAKTTTLYPNPTDGKVTVAICNLKNISVQYFISSSSGQIVSKGSQIGTNGILPFDLTSFPPGEYILNVVFEAQAFTYKIIKI